MSFKDAVRDAPSPVNKAYHIGKQALKKEHRKLVDCAEPRRITGSIDLDSALAKEPGYASQPRWDYGLGYESVDGREQAIWVEVHSATTKEVSAVLRKLQWLRDWLEEHAGSLNRLTQSASSEVRFVWIASSGVKITPNSRQARLLNTRGFPKVKRHLKLP